MRAQGDMKWIISFKENQAKCCLMMMIKKSLMEIGVCVASTFEKMKWNAQGKNVNCRAFHFTSYRCVEEYMTGFRIYGRTIKRGKFICILVI